MYERIRTNRMKCYFLKAVYPKWTKSLLKLIRKLRANLEDLQIGETHTNFAWRQVEVKVRQLGMMVDGEHDEQGRRNELNDDGADRVFMQILRLKKVWVLLDTVVSIRWKGIPLVQRQRDLHELLHDLRIMADMLKADTRSYY